MPPLDPCPDCGGTVLYQGLFVVECATETCRHYAGTVERSESAVSRSDVRATHDDDERTFIEIAREVFAYV